MKKSIKILFTAVITVFVLIVTIFAPIFVDSRPLSENEMDIAHDIFGDSIDFSKARINEGGILTWVYPGVTIGYTISFPKNKYDENNIKYQALLMHELTHVWQYQETGWTYALKALAEEIFEPNPYVVNYSEDKEFKDYDLEEQAEIIAEYYLDKTPAYQKYINEL